MLQSLLNVQSVTPQAGHVLVVGDIWIDQAQLSDQSPIAGDFLRHNSAAGLALGLAEAGLAVTLVGFVGDDELADTIEAQLIDAGVAVDLLHIKSWATFTTAHLELGNASDAKLDSQGRRLRRHKDERALPIDGMSEYESHLQNRAERYLANAGTLVLADYGLGSIAEPRALVYVARLREVLSIAVLGNEAATAGYIDADHRLELSALSHDEGLGLLQRALPEDPAELS